MPHISSVSSTGGASDDTASAHGLKEADMLNASVRRLNEQQYSKKNFAWQSSEASRISYSATDA